MEKKENAKMTFREFIHGHNATDDDIDMSVDGTDCYMTVCFGGIRLTPEAEAEFGECLDKLRVEGACVVSDIEGACVVSDNDEDYDLIDENQGLLYKAACFIESLAGYCSCADYDKWFEGENAKLI